MNFGRKDYNDRIVDLDHEIPDNEPVFLFRARDPFAPKILMQYAGELMLSSKDSSIADSVISQAKNMIEWQKLYGVKESDISRSSVDSISITEYMDKIESILCSIELDAKISESDFNTLERLMNSVYGDNSFYALTPKDFIKSDNGYNLKDEVKSHLSKMNYRLCIGVTPDCRWVIISKNI